MAVVVADLGGGAMGMSVFVEFPINPNDTDSRLYLSQWFDLCCYCCCSFAMLCLCIVIVVVAAVVPLLSVPLLRPHPDPFVSISCVSIAIAALLSSSVLSFPS